MLEALDFEIMNSTADDWESIEQIFPDVSHIQSTITQELVIQHILQLVRDGLIEEMNGGTPSTQDIIQYPKKYWFSMTKLGRERWDSEARRFYPES
jgi:hypothetical protein